jgi:hypothetical protein
VGQDTSWHSEEASDPVLEQTSARCKCLFSSISLSLDTGRIFTSLVLRESELSLKKKSKFIFQYQRPLISFTSFQVEKSWGWQGSPKSGARIP